MRRASLPPARRFAVVPLIAALYAALLWPADAPAAGISWTAQFGTRYPDDADGVAVDPAGNLYVIGQTSPIPSRERALKSAGAYRNAMRPQ